MRLILIFFLFISGAIIAQPTCPSYSSTGTSSSGYILTSDPDCAICEDTGEVGPWSGAGCAGVIVSTAYAPTLSLTLAYTAVNTVDYATISIDGGGIMTITGVNVGVAGDVIGPYLCDGSFGDVFITVTSTLPFSVVTLTNTGCSSGWVIACPGGDGDDAGRDSTGLACFGSVFLNDYLTPGIPMDGTWVELTGSGAFDTGTTEFDVDGIAPGDYEFRYDILGCAGAADTAYFTITVGDGSFAGDDADIVMCNYFGETQDLNLLIGDAEPGGVWEEITGSGQFDPVSGVFESSDLPGGFYEFIRVQVSAAPCENDTAFVRINVVEPPAVDAGPDVFVCVGGEVLMEADNPDGAVISWDGGVIDGDLFRPIATATYTVTADLLGCVTTDDVVVTLVPFPDVDAGLDVEVCQFDEVTLTADNPEGATLTWDPSVVDGEVFVPDASGTYTVTADLLGCISTDDLLITVNPLPLIGIAAVPFPAEVCLNEEVTLSGTGAGIGGTYVWDLGVVDGEAFSPTLGTTIYSVTGTDANGCENSAAINVTVNPLPVVSFTADTTMICNPDHVEFTNTTDLPGDDCVWDFGDGVSGTGCGTVSHLYNTVGDMDVTLTVTTAEGCVSAVSYADFISVLAVPDADFIYSPQPINVENTQVSFRNKTEFATNYEWFFGDESGNSTEEHPIHYYPEIPDAYYDVLLIAKNDIGCVDSISKKLYIEDVILFFIPNAFTPDGDSFNETFKLIMTSGIDFYDYHFTIFNRWGEILFESYDAQYGWDGSYGGQGIVESGVYVWQLEFGDRASDKKHLHRGHLNLSK